MSCTLCEYVMPGYPDQPCPECGAERCPTCGFRPCECEEGEETDAQNQAHPDPGEARAPRVPPRPADARIDGAGQSDVRSVVVSPRAAPAKTVSERPSCEGWRPAFSG